MTAGFEALSCPEGPATRIPSPDGTVLRDWRPGPEERANPEIDRGQLRDLLLGPIGVRWGRRATQVVPGVRGGARIVFADGRQETYDLVAGADGAWSRGRVPRRSYAGQGREGGGVQGGDGEVALGGTAGGARGVFVEEFAGGEVPAGAVGGGIRVRPGGQPRTGLTGAP